MSKSGREKCESNKYTKVFNYVRPPKRDPHLRKNSIANTRCRAMLDYADWIKQLIEKEQISDASELHFHLEKSVKHLNSKLKNIQEEQFKEVDKHLKEVENHQSNIWHKLENQRRSLRLHQNNLEEEINKKNEDIV